MYPKVKRTIAQLRVASKQQARVKVNKYGIQELPVGTWVWTSQYFAPEVMVLGDYGSYRDIIGVILDTESPKDDNYPVRKNYIVLTTAGQYVCSRAELVPATYDEVRSVEGLSAEADCKACFDEFRQNGHSEANTLRFIAAVKALESVWSEVPPIFYCENPNCQICR